MTGIKRILRRSGLLVGLAVLTLLVLAAIFAQYVAPWDPYQNSLSESLQPPSQRHWLGTDILGRDILSRLIYGSRTTLWIAVVSAVSAGAAGGLLGLLAGYLGGLGGAITMRLIDGLMCFPMLVLALFVSMILGGGIGSVIMALSVGSVAIYARLMNGLVLSIREKDYITSARSIGASNARVLISHVLPNALPPIIVQMSLHLGSIILAEASLSFLGVGIRPPGASWGAMIADGYAYLETNPVLALAPGIMLMAVAFSFNSVGDALRDRMDPRLRRAA
jgi:ABC-type dipeptide/oligopeptide/nickel transport system permease subunit